MLTTFRRMRELSHEHGEEEQPPRCLLVLTRLSLDTLSRCDKFGEWMREFCALELRGTLLESNAAHCCTHRMHLSALRSLCLSGDDLRVGEDSGKGYIDDGAVMQVLLSLPNLESLELSSLSAITSLLMDFICDCPQLQAKLRCLRISRLANMMVGREIASLRELRELVVCEAVLAAGVFDERHGVRLPKLTSLRLVDVSYPSWSTLWIDCSSQNLTELEAMDSHCDELASEQIVKVLDSCHPSLRSLSLGFVDDHVLRCLSSSFDVGIQSPRFTELRYLHLGMAVEVSCCRTQLPPRMPHLRGLVLDALTMDQVSTISRYRNLIALDIRALEVRSMNSFHNLFSGLPKLRHLTLGVFNDCVCRKLRFASPLLSTLCLVASAKVKRKHLDWIRECAFAKRLEVTGCVRASSFSLVSLSAFSRSVVLHSTCTCQS